MIYLVHLQTTIKSKPMAHKSGSDKSQVSDPQQQDEVNYISATIVADDIGRALLKKGYKLHATPNGRHCCHDIYIKKRLEANAEIYYWHLLDLNIEWAGFNAALEAVIKDLSGNGSDWITIARKIEASLTTQGNDKKSLMYGIGYNKSCYADPQLSKSFTGKLVHKQIPDVSWFPQLASLDPYDLLTLFPRAEATALLLMLGRSMVGVGGTVTQEGTIIHKMRAAAIIVGVVAGLGKSSLLNGIIEAAKQLGYHSEPIATASSRFGWGKIAASDIGYKDDLNRETQSAILKSETLKTIITGGAFSSERKGVDSETTKSNTTILCCSNDYNVYDFYKMDEGSISRFNFLYTYNATELDAKFTEYDGRTDKNFKRLADLYKVSENQLFTYLLAHGVKLFMATLGLEVINDAVVKVGEDTTQALMEGLREQFVYAPNVTHVRDLVSSTAHLVAFAIGCARSSKARKSFCEHLPDLSFDSELLYCIVNQYVHSTAEEPYRLRGLASGCKLTIAKRLEDLSNRNGNRSNAQAFEFLVAELMSAQGASFPKAAGSYFQLWVEAKKTIPTLAEKYAQMMVEDDEGETEIDFDELNSGSKNNITTIQDMLKRDLTT